jgi:AraC-like DNA-binding protein
MLARPPIAPLRPFVRVLWAGFTPLACARPGREHVLPTGHMHLALRWGGPPLRVFSGAHDPVGHSPGNAVVGGARCGYYAKEAGAPGWSVGAQLEPGAAGALLRTSAADLAEHHTPLADVCGPGTVSELMERLQTQGDPEACLHVLETWLLARMVRTVRGLHPAIAAALASLHAGAPVQQAVQASGLSHRHLIAQFRDATGLAPKQHARVLRLQAALAGLQAPGVPAAGIAADAGFSDQAHFTREFHTLTGVTPTAWLRAAPAQRNHVRVG